MIGEQVYTSKASYVIGICMSVCPMDVAPPGPFFFFFAHFISIQSKAEKKIKHTLCTIVSFPKGNRSVHVIIIISSPWNIVRGQCS